MYLSTTILPLALLLTTVTPTHTMSTLSKRAKNGDIASYVGSQCTKKDPNSQRIFLDKGICHQFNTTTDNFGINFGSGDSGMCGVVMFTDTDCKNHVTNGYKAPKKMASKGAGLCVSVYKTGFLPIGQKWQSAMRKEC